MRVFAALPLPPALCDFVHESGVLIKKQYHGIRLVGSTAMHITLYFFGETAQEQVDVLLNLMESPGLKRPQFTVSLGALAQFPARGRPRVLFYDLTEGKQEVRTVFSLFRELIAENGWPVESGERPFTPHITIARNKFEHIDLNSLKSIPGAESSFKIDRLVLFQSILKPGGAEYIELKTVMFNA
ncbi:MAG: RNA 2',3'-cyclic phosphodiesterase [Spirochaetales bacterium]|nr:RNA 2',3'-cyclic phosphodiesterase [Spirochaetales bacterium]